MSHQLLRSEIYTIFALFLEHLTFPAIFSVKQHTASWSSFHALKFKVCEFLTLYEAREIRKMALQRHRTGKTKQGKKFDKKLTVIFSVKIQRLFKPTTSTPSTPQNLSLPLRRISCAWVWILSIAVTFIVSTPASVAKKQFWGGMIYDSHNWPTVSLLYW